MSKRELRGESQNNMMRGSKRGASNGAEVMADFCRVRVALYRPIYRGNA